MALNIFNEFFSTSGSVQSKSAFGHIKRYKEENNIPDEIIRFHFKPEKVDNTLFFLTLDTWSELDPGHVNFIIQNLFYLKLYTLVSFLALYEFSQYKCQEYLL